MRPGRAITPDLLERVRRHKAELLPILPSDPPSVTLEPRESPMVEGPDAWIVSSGSNGSMRLVVAGDPGDWTPAVWRAAALVEVLDDLHKADRCGSQAIVDELERVLSELQREGTTAWLTS